MQAGIACSFDMRHYQADQMIKDLPPADADHLTIRELAIHKRAYEQGASDGKHSLKRQLTDKFQLTFFGHVL
jgi:hypothetical protein